MTKWLDFDPPLTRQDKIFLIALLILAILLIISAFWGK